MAQYVILITVYGKRAKYGATKGIAKTAQLVYPWITRDQVYANMRLLKQRGRDHESLEHGAPPAAGTAQPEGPQPVIIENTVDLRGGRPKGTTAAATRSLNERKRKALNYATLQFNELRHSVHGKGVVVKIGELQRVITTVLEESGLKVDAPSFTIEKYTVRSRVKAQTELTKSSTGIATPMATVEPLLV